MREYTTQMDAARKGIITKELKIVAEKEHMQEEELRKLVAESENIVFYGGAGVSTESGSPDCRSQDGL